MCATRGYRQQVQKKLTWVSDRRGKSALPLQNREMMCPWAVGEMRFVGLGGACQGSALNLFVVLTQIPFVAHAHHQFCN